MFPQNPNVEIYIEQSYDAATLQSSQYSDNAKSLINRFQEAILDSASTSSTHDLTPDQALLFLVKNELIPLLESGSHSNLFEINSKSIFAEKKIEKIHMLIHFINSQYLSAIDDIIHLLGIDSSKVKFERGAQAIKLYPRIDLRFMKDIDISCIDYPTAKLISNFFCQRGFEIVEDDGTSCIAVQREIALPTHLKEEKWLKGLFEEVFSTGEDTNSPIIFFDIKVDKDIAMNRGKVEDAFIELIVDANHELEEGYVNLKHLMDSILALDYLRLDISVQEYESLTNSVSTLMSFIGKLGYTSGERGLEYDSRDSIRAEIIELIMKTEKN